ncbi:hypothetical protein MMC13_000585 [Lambiella insularis]|nr:hypothetical protein [Lambiella insularis]
MSSPPFTSAQPRERLPEEDLGSLSSDGSLYADSGPEVDHSASIGARRQQSVPEKESQSDPACAKSPWPRHGGPNSTWRTWTAPDRAIAKSLDQLQAQDLSLHLYNAFALRKRAERARLQPEEEREEGALWEPPKLWTAWPLPSDQVPPLAKGTWDDLGVGEPIWQSLDRAIGPSAQLGEILTGVILKIARERFVAEYSNHDDNDSPRAKKPSGARNSSRSRSRATSTAPSEPDTVTSNPSQSSEQDTDDPEIGPSTNPPSAKTSSATEPEVSRSRGAHPAKRFDDPRLKSLKPVIMADEETASSILQPSIRHILSDLDTLLMGLHHARRASLRIKDDSASETHTDAEDDTHASNTSRSRSRSKSQKRSAPPRRKPKPSSHPKDNDSDASSSSSAESKRPAPKRAKRSSSPKSRARALRRKRARMGLRDWSDVLGVAAMQGWDRRVIDAAARRCAALFGEGMELRVLEGKGVEEVSYLPGGARKRTR